MCELIKRNNFTIFYQEIASFFYSINLLVVSFVTSSATECWMGTHKVLTRHFSRRVSLDCEWLPCHLRVCHDSLCHGTVWGTLDRGEVGVLLLLKLVYYLWELVVGDAIQVGVD